MKVLVKITKEVLFKTRKCNNMPGKNCAIAFAVREIFPNAHVSLFEILFDFDRAAHLRSDLPIEAISFIRAFDHLDEHDRILMPEFSFEIPVPDEVINIISIGKIYKVLSESHTLELVHP